MIAAARIQRMTRLFEAHIIAAEETFRRGRGPACSIESWDPPAQGHQAARDAVRDPRGPRRRPITWIHSDAANATILIVDDEPRVLDALEAVLGRRVSRPPSRNGAAAALELLADRGRRGGAHRLPDARHDRRRDAPRGQDVAPDAVRMVLTAYTDVDSLMDADQHRPHLSLRGQAVGSRRSCSSSCGVRPSATRSPRRTLGCATSWSSPTTPSGAGAETRERPTVVRSA